MIFGGSLEDWASYFEGQGKAPSNPAPRPERSGARPERALVADEDRDAGGSVAIGKTDPRKRFRDHRKVGQFDCAVFRPDRAGVVQEIVKHGVWERHGD